LENNFGELLKTIKTIDFNNFKLLVPEPQKYKTTRGGDLFGYPADELCKAELYYTFFTQNLMFNEAQNILNQIKVSNVIEEFALWFKAALFKNKEQVSFLNGINDVRMIIIELYRRFLNCSQEIVIQSLDKKMDIYGNIWQRIVPDEDQVTPEQIGRFYNSLPFPTGDFFIDCAENNLTIAYRMLPVLLAVKLNLKNVFDFGGNSGLITSVLAGSSTTDNCLLIEENEKLLNFAEWRDHLFGIQNVSYKKESEIIAELDSYKESFDLGICTEVLEHVFFVEETVSHIAALLKNGGLLYQTTSFGLYPEYSHLKKNIRYAGHEDELMANYGLDRINIDFQIPLLPNIRIYKKRCISPM
jgi:2-polyprenyl-3-methyl-5-hydroxy-6-metoxy-1,4-benzoquinol methylase